MMRDKLITYATASAFTLFLSGNMISCNTGKETNTAEDTLAVKITPGEEGKEGCATGFRIDYLEIKQNLLGDYEIIRAVSNLTGSEVFPAAITPDPAVSECREMIYTVPDAAVQGDKINYAGATLNFNAFNATDLFGIGLRHTIKGTSCKALDCFISIKDTRYPPPSGDTARFTDSDENTARENISEFLGLFSIKKLTISRDAPGGEMFTVELRMERTDQVNYEIQSIANVHIPNTAQVALVVWVKRRTGPPQIMHMRTSGLKLANVGASGPYSRCPVGPVSGTPPNPVYTGTSPMPFLVVEQSASEAMDIENLNSTVAKKGIVCFK